MANILEFWANILVTPDMLNTVQDNLQAADQAMMVDTAFGGVFYGLAVAERGGGANLSVDVSAGAAYDWDGQRTRTPSTQNVPVDEDYDAVSTAVVGVGNERWVSVSISFKRDESDPYVDGNSTPGNFVQDEGYEWVVKQGAEAGAGLAARPALLADAVLLADVKLIKNQTTVVNADISTTRRQLPFDLTGSVHALKAGRVGGTGGALEQLLGWLDGHVSGSADKHAATAINYAGGAAWADGTTNPATTVELQLDKIVSDLSTTNGGVKIKSPAWTIGVVSIAASNVYTQLQQLASAGNHSYLGGGTWADGSTNPATTVELQLDKNISDLAATSASGGLAKVGCGARVSWLGGRTNPATTAFAALNKVIEDINAQDAGDDGMERVGGEARAGSPNSLSAGSAASQVAALLGFVNGLEGRVSAVASAAYTYTTRGGTIDSPSGIASWTSSSLSVTLNSLATGQKVRVTATFGIGGTPTGAYSLRLAANGTLVNGTEHDAEIKKTVTLDGLYTIPSGGNYTFTMQYQNPSTGMATMNILGSATLIAQPVY